MEAIKLTKEQLSEEFSACENLKQLILNIENGLWADRSVLCQISVNGEWLDEAAEEALHSTRLTEINEVQYQAKPLVSLVKENISAITDWLEGSRVAINTAMELADQGEMREFNNYLLSIYEGCQWFIDSLSFLKSPIKQINCEVIEEAQWQKLTDDFMVIIRDCVEAFERQDTQEVVDLMGVKLSENFDKWLVLLNNQDKLIKGI